MNKYMIAFIISIIIASFSQILLKKGSMQKNIYINIYTILGYFIMFLSTILTLYGYKNVSLIFSQLLQSTSYLFVMILSKIFLREKISLNMIIGNILIVISLLLYN